MHIFSYSPDPNNPHDQVSVNITVPSDANLETVLRAMEGYLLACGFVINGTLDVTEGENTRSQTQPEIKS